MSWLLQVFDPANIGAFFAQIQTDLQRPVFWLAVGKIIWINILLSGDNALVIAMACRGLHGRHRLWGMIIGAGIAVVLLIAFTGVVATLMALPYLKLIGGLALLVIAAKLLVPEDEDDEIAAGIYTLISHGTLRKGSPDLLVKCVRKIAAGETWIDNQSVNWVIEAYRSQATSLVNPRNQPRLNQKEMLIIAGITQGKRNKEIAYQLGTTEQVVKNYLRKIYDKLGVSDRLELALYCLHHQLHKRAAEIDAQAVEVAAAQTT